MFKWCEANAEKLDRRILQCGQLINETRYGEVVCKWHRILYKALHATKQLRVPGPNPRYGFGTLRLASLCTFTSEGTPNWVHGSTAWFCKGKKTISILLLPISALIYNPGAVDNYQAPTLMLLLFSTVTQSCPATRPLPRHRNTPTTASHWPACARCEMTPLRTRMELLTPQHHEAEGGVKTAIRKERNSLSSTAIARHGHHHHLVPFLCNNVSLTHRRNV